MDNFNVMDFKFHLSHSQWTVIEVCSYRGTALKSNSSARPSTDILHEHREFIQQFQPRQRSECSNIQNLDWKAFSATYCKLSLLCIAWHHLLSGPRKKCAKFLPAQALHVCLPQTEFSSWPFLIISLTCPADTAQESPTPWALTQVIKYERDQLGVWSQSSTRGLACWARRALSVVPRARHKRTWCRRQRAYCQKPCSQGESRTTEIKWLSRIQELNHPWSSDIPGFPKTPARSTGEDLEWVPVEAAPSH